jgi:hypothetical protein
MFMLFFDTKRSVMADEKQLTAKIKLRYTDTAGCSVYVCLCLLKPNLTA